MIWHRKFGSMQLALFDTHCLHTKRIVEGIVNTEQRFESANLAPVRSHVK